MQSSSWTPPWKKYSNGFRHCRSIQWANPHRRSRNLLARNHFTHRLCRVRGPMRCRPLISSPIPSASTRRRLSNRLTLSVIYRCTRRPSPNEADQHHNRSEIEASESSAPSGYGQPYVCGLGINQTYRRAVFEVNASLAQTDLPMYSKNPIILLPNVPSNYITNSVAFSARSLTHDNGKPILVWRTNVRETASTSQPIGPAAIQTSFPTLSAIAQSGMSQSLGLISVDGTNPWILDSGATYHLTGKGQIVLFDGFSLQNVLHVPKLSYNLLSISKIICELHCKATFLPECLLSGLEFGEDDWHCPT
ncbi:reverse transcriptase [Cucumis melo var. makuwa]|uniref:Reverse transcriptase n=1 Tax=Cucumis melo var. makuwa TaxID=1194695 RepID=A0A5D3CIV8_CUCMM|nr:reverse transcriptase [Cucumis melo var. makuwa]